MPDAKMLEAFLNSLKNPFLFVDNDHIIRYMNNAAARHYKEGVALLGTSIFDCHNGESNAVIKKIFAEMKSGLDERMITDNEKYRIYMRAVRDEKGMLLGYYERYEPPVKMVPPA
ncbi:MAG: PAS domain-containing protein [Candidatus Eisenbacteria bacterium]|uniref:PAS domain-containing protein n=1 Tax=Eiseniibacteriota bacterium TaxID=2212470 RepID=A0A948S1P0_UNCEI|nr:PAS domain-containing protein [Candidatus Eisenbacteria bacterium]MBU1950678.1 PAS domain-containing protein [Candidatus Eisenbacteria bacterium]MBU2693267.1 PAS domain-containing protein [Candidatus Eisenbacteria bacterium]